MKKILIPLTTFFILIAVIVIIIAAVNRASVKDYVVKINGKAVTVSEYKVYLYEQKMTFEETGGEDIWETAFDGVAAQDVAKQNVLSSLLFIKPAADEAARLGLELDENDGMNVMEESRELYDELMQADLIDKIGTDFDEIYNIIKENRMQSKLYDFLTKDYKLSEVDFEVYVQEYYEENKKNLTRVKVLYIFVSDDDSEKDAGQIPEAAYEEILQGENFEDVAAKYSEDEQKEPVTVTGEMFEQELLDEIYSLDNLEVSDLLKTSSGYYIFKAVEVITPDMDELKTELRDTYIETKKQEIYKEQSDKWAASAVVEKNMPVWDSINITDV